VRTCRLLLTLALAALALSGSADAITRQQANTIALKTLKPQALKGPTILFGLPKALPPKAVVVEAGSAKITAVPFIPKGTATGKAAWLFWLDQAAYAHFQHPSRLLLIDDGTGKVLRNRALSFYPLVDGKRPAYLSSWKVYGSATYHVFSNLPKGVAAARTPAVPLAPVSTRAVPANAFKDDCLISIGLRDDPLFSGDFGGGIVGWAQSVGLRAFKPPNGPAGRPAGGAQLRSGVRDIVTNQRCKDVFIFMSGHGYDARSTPAIQTGAVAGAPWIGVTAGDVRTILRDHPTVTFKVKINGCYSGRFVDPLKGEPNLLTLETAANASEYSWGALPRRFVHPDGRTIDVPEHENPGRSEFVNGNVAGLEAFFASAAEVAQARDQGGSLLARALDRAFDLGTGSDGARGAALTHPQRVNNLDFQVNALIGYRHLGTTSEVCVSFGTKPARARVAWSAAIAGPGVIEATTKNGSTGSVGEGAVNWGINRYGTYKVTVTVTDERGAKSTTTASVTVTEAQGTCP